MKIPIPLFVAGVVALTTFSAQAAFRVRSDFSAPLNANQGWAGGLDENVTVNADQPFRLRMEVERPRGANEGRGYRLQYRRNAGVWTSVEAHDFPYPLRELEVDFTGETPGATPAGWSVASGEAAGLTVQADGPQRILRARAGRDPLMGLYSPPWESRAFTLAAVFRLPAGSPGAVALVFGYVDARNHGRIVLDAAAGTLRVSRLVNGMETAVTERSAAMVPGEWIELEISGEGGELEVNFQDAALEFTASLGADIPASALGFFVPPGHTADFRAFVIEGEPATPRVSIVGTTAYRDGDATTDLLARSPAAFRAGAGLNLSERTPATIAAGAHGEFEWPLVVRRFADGAVTNEAGDTFEFRMIDETGLVVNTGPNPALRLAIEPGHVGGTFVETPGRIGPWQAANGDLYFIMEPAETDNLFMMIKSTDNGRTWREVDGANRPATGDLESVDGRQVGDTIHIIHQVTRSTRYHAFRTSDHPTHPDTWSVRDEQAAAATAVAQGTTLVVRPDGSMVTFYVGQTIHYAVRSPAGLWSPEIVMDEGLPPNSAGPQAVLGANGTVHLAYYGMDGTIWYRRLLANGTLTPRQQLASGVGSSRAEFGSVLPLAFIPQSNTVVVLYQVADGKLWERRIVNDGPPTPAVRVTDRNVVRQAVDSQQPGADVVLDGSTLHVLFIEEESRSIFSTSDRGGWQPSSLRVDNISGSWVRGNVHTRADGVRVYGYVYDAGSEGGAGMNRFGEIVVGSRSAADATVNPEVPGGTRLWLAGDHHIHSRYSVGLDRTTVPPTPVIGGPDGEPYPIAMNAVMARHYGLSWMVSTDHGGPYHSKVNLEKAYPELVQSRQVVPEVIQFYGMELNPPAADHSSLIIPHSDHEHTMLFEIESGYDKQEVFPRDPSRDTEAKMIEALTFMSGLSPQPVLLANHPSRSATGLGVYGQDRPDELRNWNDAAPSVAVGMEGSPGHQAGAINPDGSIDPEGARGGYRQHPTMGGYDQMTARLGGFWDSMLGEGRRWWVTANSDSHVNWREGGSDFWPGEYSKTYVFAEKNHDDILDGIRHGRIFVTTGDLITELHVTASAAGSAASIGGTLPITGRSDVTVTIRFLDPAGPNHHGDNPHVARVDLIVGDITGPLADRTRDSNPTTRVVKRFTAGDWTREGDYLTMTHTLQGVHHSSYLRVRGTNSGELEPTPDPKGEDPWSDLWFYSNPIFIEIK